MQVNRYNALLTKRLIKRGFRKEELSSSDFDIAFIWQKVGIKIVFLLKDIGEIDGGGNYISNLTNLGRNWCVNNVNARWFISPVVLNFIYFHRGQLHRDHIAGKTDSMGLHSTIIRSISTIDISKNSIVQERGWIIGWKIKDVLHLLPKIAQRCEGQEKTSGAWTGGPRP